MLGAAAADKDNLAKFNKNAKDPIIIDTETFKRQSTAKEPSQEPLKIHYPQVQLRRDLSPLVRPEDQADIDGFLKRYPNLADKYIPVSIIGEGTDRSFEFPNNNKSLQVPLAPFTRLSMCDTTNVTTPHG